MYPLRFEKVFKEKIWGERKFETLLDMKLPDDKSIGESWEVTSHKNGMSIVENGEFAGRSLASLVEEYKAKLVGERVYEEFNTKFPLLIKYLDVNDRLSVQVHPDDSYALRVEGEFGKSESWYILDASPDAKLIAGISDGITKEEFARKAADKDFEGIFNVVPVKKGDFVNVNPGLVHATLEGSVVICEVQQNSDTTYRIYDFDRLVDGELRPLHLDKAQEVIEFGMKPEITSEEDRESIEVEGAVIQELIRGEYFNIDKVKVEGAYKDPVNSNFKVLSILDGKGKILSENKEYEFKKGETYLIPAELEMEITGSAEILKSYL